MEYVLYVCDLLSGMTRKGNIRRTCVIMAG